MATEKKVKPNETVEVRWLAACKFHKEGNITKVHPVQAEKLVKAKKAEYVDAKKK